AASYETGISDQVPSSFLNPLFQPLGLSAARYITPYDVMNLPAGSPDRVALSQWVRNAGGQDLLVSFEHSHTRGRERHVPNVAEYTKAIKLFLRAFPKVHSISPWNEANRCQRRVGSGANAFYVGQPICHNPKRAADYYKATRTACRALHRRCTIVALDILDQNKVGPSVGSVRHVLRYARPGPATANPSRAAPRARGPGRPRPMRRGMSRRLVDPFLAATPLLVALAAALHPLAGVAALVALLATGVRWALPRRRRRARRGGR